MKPLDVDRRLITATAISTKNPGSPLQQLRTPCRNLVGVNIKLLRQLGQRLLPLDRLQRFPCLERRAVVAAWSLAHIVSCHAAPLAAVRQKIHSSHCPILPGHL